MLRRLIPRAFSTPLPPTPIARNLVCPAAAAHPFRAPFLSMASTLPKLPIFEAIASHDPRSTVVVHSASGRSFTYGELLHDVAKATDQLKQSAGRGVLEGERVAFLVENSYDYVVTLLSILSNHAIAVPLSQGFPAPELRYILDQSQAMMLLASEKFKGKAEDVLKEDLESKPIFATLEKRLGGSSPEGEVRLQSTEDGKGGMMLYTSGTTNRPKGVLIPTRTLTAQCRSLQQAWEYTPADHLLHLLPLHHIHGTVNAILTPLFSGSSIEFLYPFNPTAIWTRLASPFLSTSNGTTTHNLTSKHNNSPITFFTVVPTIYNRLLSTHPSLEPDVQSAGRIAVSPEHLRLSISGSAALPSPTKARWAELSHGNILLERYGMTEVGMALSCGLAFADRVDGSVGWPLPSVEIRLVDSDTNTVIAPGEEIDKETGKEREGEIQLRGPTIFAEYWRNPSATASEFVDGGDGLGAWFKTGDVAVRRYVKGAGQSTAESQSWAKGPMYFIHGRKSVDIIKSGGEKISALEVERELLSLPEVAEAAVVALPSGSWGQKCACVVVLTPEGKTAGRNGGNWSALDMRKALRERLAAYKIPQEMKVVDEIPRNAMGKVNKKGLIREVWGDDAGSGDEKGKV